MIKIILMKGLGDQKCCIRDSVAFFSVSAQYIFIVQSGNQAKYNFEWIFNVVFIQRVYIEQSCKCHVSKQFSEHAIELYVFIYSLKSIESSSNKKKLTHESKVYHPTNHIVAASILEHYLLTKL